MNHVIQKSVSAVPYKKFKTKRNRDLETASSDKEVFFYLINCLNLGDAYNDLYSDFDWLLTQRRHFQMAHKINKMIINNDECNVLTKFWNPTKCAKPKNGHHSPIVQVCMNICRGKGKFGNFQILLDRGSSSTILMKNTMSKLKFKNSTTTTWQIQARNFTTNKITKVGFYLPEFSATKIVTWKFHVGDSTESKSNIILGRNLLTAMVLYIKFSKHIIIGGDGPYGGWSEPMVDINNYDFQYLTDKTIKPEY